MRAARVSRVLRRGIVAILALGAVLALAGCGSEEGEVLARDPLATREIEGLSTTSESTQGTSSTDLKETYPSHRRTLAVEEGISGDEAIERVAQAAEDAGWSVGPRTPSGFSATKDVDGQEATAKAALSATHGQQEVTLLLTLL